MKKRKSGGESIAESFRVPSDVSKGETLLRFVGMRSVHIENYRSILLYSDTCIRIQAKHYILNLGGKNLKIRYYDKDEMEVTGRMEVIRFE